MIERKIIDYRELIEKSTADFVGRQWVRDEIEQFLKNDKPRCFLLLGEPGSGKTAFMADLSRRRFKDPHHFVGLGCQVDLAASTEWCDPIRFAESVGYQLVRNYGGWVMRWDDWGIKVSQKVKELKGTMVGAKIGAFRAMPKGPTVTVEEEVEVFGEAAEMIGVYIEKFVADPEPAVYQLVTMPLKAIAENYKNLQIVVLIDGLDEATTYSNESRNIVSLLPDHGLPPNVRFLLTSRPGEHLSHAFLDRVHKLWLSSEKKKRPEHRIVEDAETYVKSLAQSNPVKQMLSDHGVDPVAFVDEVVTASDCNFLYLHHYSEAVRSGDTSLLNLKRLPKKLNGIYHDFLSKYREDVGSLVWKNEWKPCLGVLAVIREPITCRQLSEFSGLDMEDVSAILVDLRPFLQEFGEDEFTTYKIYCRSFAEYLVSTKNRYYIDKKKAHTRIVTYFFDNCVPCEEPYAVKYLLSHLIGGEQWTRAKEVVTDIEFLQRKQNPTEQYRFQDEVTRFIRCEAVSNDKLADILESALATITGELETSKEKADWLDIFAYWLNEFGPAADEERRRALRTTAVKFDYACAEVSKKLIDHYLAAKEADWALRFAELVTWVYQRAGAEESCIDACEFAEQLCQRKGMGEAYRVVARREFARMRAAALDRSARSKKPFEPKTALRSKARQAYEDLNQLILSEDGPGWIPSIEQWRLLGKDTGRVPSPPSFAHKFKKVQVVSSAHDGMSALFIIRWMEGMGASVKWTHVNRFRPRDLASPKTALTILIGGPKSPGSSKISEYFYKADRRGFLELYSAAGMVAKVLKMQRGNTLCCMVGGPSKINTMTAAYDVTTDGEVLDWLVEQPS